MSGRARREEEEEEENEVELSLVRIERKREEREKTGKVRFKVSPSRLVSSCLGSVLSCPVLVLSASTKNDEETEETEETE